MCHRQHHAEMKLLLLANNLTYYSTEYITGTKCFIMLGHGQRWAEIKLANDLAYYSLEFITGTKSFITLGHGQRRAE